MHRWKAENVLCCSRCLDSGRQFSKALLARQEFRENNFFFSELSLFLTYGLIIRTLSVKGNMLNYSELSTWSALQIFSLLPNTTKDTSPKALFFSFAPVVHSWSKVSLQLKPPVGPWVRGRMGGSVSCHIPVSPNSSQEQNPRYGIFRTICTKSLEF